MTPSSESIYNPKMSTTEITAEAVIAAEPEVEVEVPAPLTIRARDYNRSECATITGKIADKSTGRSAPLVFDLGWGSPVASSTPKSHLPLPVKKQPATPLRTVACTTAAQPEYRASPVPLAREATEAALSGVTSGAVTRSFEITPNERARAVPRSITTPSVGTPSNRTRYSPHSSSIRTTNTSAIDVDYDRVEIASSPVVLHIRRSEDEPRKLRSADRSSAAVTLPSRDGVTIADFSAPDPNPRPSTPDDELQKAMDTAAAMRSGGSPLIDVLRRSTLDTGGYERPTPPSYRAKSIAIPQLGTVASLASAQTQSSFRSFDSGRSIVPEPTYMVGLRAMASTPARQGLSNTVFQFQGVGENSSRHSSSSGSTSSVVHHRRPKAKPKMTNYQCLQAMNSSTGTFGNSCRLDSSTLAFSPSAQTLPFTTLFETQPNLGDRLREFNSRPKPDTGLGSKAPVLPMPTIPRDLTMDLEGALEEALDREEREYREEQLTKAIIDQHEQKLVDQYTLPEKRNSGTASGKAVQAVAWPEMSRLSEESSGANKSSFWDQSFNAVENALTPPAAGAKLDVMSPTDSIAPLIRKNSSDSNRADKSYMRQESILPPDGLIYVNRAPSEVIKVKKRNTVGNKLTTRGRSCTNPLRLASNPLVNSSVTRQSKVFSNPVEIKLGEPSAPPHSRPESSTSARFSKMRSRTQPSIVLEAPIEDAIAEAIDSSMEPPAGHASVEPASQDTTSASTAFVPVVESSVDFQKAAPVEPGIAKATSAPTTATMASATASRKKLSISIPQIHLPMADREHIYTPLPTGQSTTSAFNVTPPQLTWVERATNWGSKIRERLVHPKDDKSKKDGKRKDKGKGKDKRSLFHTTPLATPTTDLQEAEKRALAQGAMPNVLGWRPLHEGEVNTKYPGAKFTCDLDLRARQLESLRIQSANQQTWLANHPETFEAPTTTRKPDIIQEEPETDDVFGPPRTPCPQPPLCGVQDANTPTLLTQAASRMSLESPRKKTFDIGMRKKSGEKEKGEKAGGKQRLRVPFLRQKMGMGMGMFEREEEERKWVKKGGK